VHARYLQLLGLKGHETVLEVGTGSGYQTVLLSHLAARIFSIERVSELLDRARQVIAECGVRNVSLMLGDGTLGWRQHAPFDAILVSAGAPEVPRPLLEQLADGGRLIVPLGDMETQMLATVTRNGDQFDRRDIAPVRFVPLWGTHGWTG
jgi:protein-L-isoaspartate(D-aspartate) O-methyltransferase